MTDTPAIIAQLRTLEQLTRTENQVARIRMAQARTDQTRKELADNAERAEQRLDRIQQALRELDAVPDFVGTLAGRIVALVKSQAEQAQRFDEALLGDLALERQLQDRARYLQALTADGPDRVHRLAGELVEAHTETVEWLTTVLAEAAVGGPAPLRATPMQVVRGGLTHVVRLPARVTAGGINRAGNEISRAGERARRSMAALADGVDRAARDAGDILGAGFDAALDRAEQVARGEGAPDTARLVHGIRRTRGALTAAELPVPDYDALPVGEAADAIRRLDSLEAVQAVLRYEEQHKNRTGVVTVARTRHAEVAREAVS
ncbi:ferritin-like domain-containing protein [Pseudonocardia sp. NPDC049635]|uniref:ferritin-like domain-containing protein n=1 Tax=Pseudonocardia sp. NPDC049635 TaxID=3155506 RepID=UPI0033C2F747